MADSYKNAELVKLSDFIPTDNFRTVTSDCRHLGEGYSEIFVEIHMKPRFVKTLSFNVDWDGIVYGYVNEKWNIIKKLGNFESLKKITISDWDGRFLLLFEGIDEKEEKPYLVKPEDVRELLENCMRAPEQASVK